MSQAIQQLRAPYCVLIVDDDVMLCDAYERIVRHAGGRPICAGNGKEACEVLKNNTVHIMLVDLRMPVMNGIELLEWMHAENITGPIIVVLSNYDSPKDIQKAYRLGAERFVLKAWATPNDLITVLNESLSSKQYQPNCDHI